MQTVLLQDTWRTLGTKERGVRLYCTLRNLTGEKLIALPSFLADPKNTFDNRGVCESSAVRVLAYLLSGSAKEVCFSTKHVLQEANYLQLKASQRLGKDNIDLKTQCSKSTRQCFHIFPVMEKVNSYVRGLKPSSSKVMLEELRCVPPNDRPNFVDARCIDAAKDRSQRTLMEHSHPSQLVNTKTSNMWLPLFMLIDTPDAPCTGSTLSLKQGSDLTCVPLLP